VSEPTKDNPKAPKRSSRRKPAMEPLGWDEIVSQPGMGGYLSFLNGPVPLPHLQPPVPEIPPTPVVVSDPAVAPDPDVVTGPDVETAPFAERINAPPGVESTPVVVTHSGIDTAPEVAPNPARSFDIQSDPVVASSPGYAAVPVSDPAPALRPVSGLVTTTGRRPRIRRCAAAHDGHSLGEEVLYQALWKTALGESTGARTIVIGWRGMSQLCRMTPKNCKINTQRLIRKLALEVLSPYNTPESIGTTYRIFPSEAIVRRRRAAGLEWVVRSRGVEFVDPSTGIPLAAHLCGYASEEASPV
jgi:hypothetical protein